MNDQGTMQRTLSPEQIEAFYHGEFVDDQVRNFIELASDIPAHSLIVDVGGGCGFFAKRLSEQAGLHTCVIDSDPQSIANCVTAGIEARLDDALSPRILGNENMVCFNLILHHLVGGSEADTVKLQRRALEIWRDQVKALFVNEYIYESYLGNLSGWLIFQITSSRVLSVLGRAIAWIVPAFRANTFGIGVRFRAHHEWIKLFDAAGLSTLDCRIGEEEEVALPLRLLLIKSIRRDSYLLQPKPIPAA